MVPEMRRATDRIFCHFGLFFVLPPLTTPKINILKKSMEILSFYICVPQMKIIWLQLLIYGVRQTEFIVILDHFLPFYPNSNQQNQHFEKNEKKNTWRYYHFTHVYHKYKVIWCMPHEIWSASDRIFSHFGAFTWEFCP